MPHKTTARVPSHLTNETRSFQVLESDAELEHRVVLAIAQSQKYLRSLQHPDGYWVAELFVDCTLVSDHILFMHWLRKVDVSKQARSVKHILENQLPDGGWNIYPTGPGELNATVKAYLALKLAGFRAEEPQLRRAQATILRLGGIPKCNTYTKLFLALLGIFPWRHLPIIPSELILLPNWLYFNIYEMSAWSRAMVVPLAIINHFMPSHHLPKEHQIHELYPYGTEYAQFSLPWSKKLISWQNFFLCWNAGLRFVDSLPWRPFRARALKKAEQWIVDRMGEGSDGLGGIFPAMLYALVALKALGYSEEHPLYKKAWNEYEDLHVDDAAGNDFRIQPCFSPIWDTAITTMALAESGVPSDDPALQKAAAWLISKEVRVRGDWYVKNPHPVNSGWAFEFNNVYYPDVDDTWKVLLALSVVRMPDETARQEVMKRACDWARSFQCKNGGWAAFDKDVTKKWLEDVPFADHNAILDPPCSDITSRALEVFGRMGMNPNEKFIRRAVRFIRNIQEEDGSWIGRWGVNYIYGTWLVLRGLRFIDEDMNEGWILRGRDWLESCQNPADGGWGETPASYNDSNLKGRGPSTASQTAWALMGIMSCGDINRPSIRKGITYLCRLQNVDGSWTEDLITGTGFPKVFYLKYDLYRNNWPLLALAEYEKLLEKKRTHF